MSGLANFVWIAILVGIFILLLCIGEFVIPIIYELFPSFRKMANKEIDNIPEWNEEDE